MGLFSKFFSSGPPEPGASASYTELMAYGKRQLFMGRRGPAARAFTRAAGADPENPLPLAYRSWAGRLDDKARAISDANAAIDLDPSCSEAYMSLALAHTTGKVDFELALMAVNQGKKNPPADADGSVLFLGVYLLFVDVLNSSREDAGGFSYDFKATPLRNAADWLLSGRNDAAFAAFGRIYKSGNEVAGALGIAPASWAMEKKETAKYFAGRLLTGSSIKDRGILAAIRMIHDAASS